ncbi:MAG: ATP-binding protein [Desulfobacteraceae bacterium]|jgi:PAS domain S-box-containing protein
MKIFRIIFKDRSLWYKLTFPSVLPVIFIIAIVSLMLMGSFETAMLKEAESRADSLVNLTRISLSHSFVVYNKELLDNFVDGLGNMDDVRFALIVDSADNRILAHSNHTMDGRLISELPEDMQSLHEADNTNTSSSNYMKPELSYMQSAPVIINDRQYASFYIAFTFDEVHRKMATFKQLVLLVSIISICSGIAFALLAAKKIGTPVNSLAMQAELAGKGDFDHRLVYDGKDAIGQMTDAFNQMLDKIKAKQMQLTAINRIADIVYSSLDMNTVAESAVHAMMKYSKSPAVAFFLLNKKKECLELLYAEGFNEETLKKASILPLEGSLTGRAVKTKQVVSIIDLTTDNTVEPGVRDALTREDMHSVYSVPILARDEVLGAMNLIHKSRHTIDELEKETLMSIGKTIGLAVANAIQVTLIQDEIGERREVEKALKESELKYRNLVERANDGIVILQDGLIKYANPSAVELSGEEEKDFIGQPFTQYLHPDERGKIEELYRRRLSGKVPDNIYETIFLRKDRENIFAEVNASRTIYLDQPADQVIIRDISERRRAQEELKKAYDQLELKVAERTSELAIAKERAEESDRLKSAFLASMSHELRTPLNSIIGFTGIILQELVGPLNEEQSKQLGMVQDSAHHLLSLINDVLDLSKIEAGQLNVASEKFNIGDIINTVIKTVSPMAEKKGLLLETNISPLTSDIRSDKRRVEQILLNLVNNSIKFTEKGNIKISCESDGEWIITSIKDTGIGIAPEDRNKLFRAFQQIETGLARRFEGTGLGLSICKKLVRLLGGEISAHSNGPGKGSVFTFTLPAGGK